ncbi:SRPBCC family protein [Actinomadura scrupuli]|uniref:SRPBCC family protein n=1 Tax=Actinomadura scrupuli TaxID=559629 RepID=UPI003D956B76
MTDKYDPNVKQIARALGWGSLGLGLAQLAAPRAVSRLSGIDDSATGRAMVPMMGIREIVQGAGLLRGRNPAPWVWTRVAGDATDLTMLGQAMGTRRGRRRMRVAAVTAAVGAITALDLYAAYRMTAAERRRGTRLITKGTMRLRAAITVRSPRPEVYLFWHLFDNLPSFMSHLESVRETGDGRSHWTARSPIGRSVEWDAEIIAEIPDELITWRSLEGADVANSGSVRFSDAPGGRGTEVRVQMEFELPGGRLGAAVARLFGEHPEQQVRDDLRRFKQVLETGEVIRSEGSPEGTRAWRQVRQRPAQPAGRR